MILSRREWLEIAGANAAAFSLGSSVLASSRLVAAAGDRIALYDELEARLRGVAGGRAQTLSRTGLELRANHGALSATFDQVDISSPGGAGAVIPADGQMTFAVDVPKALWVRGELTLAPDADLRPGLRATVLCDTTVVGAPMVTAAPWGVKEITDAAPVVAGDAPPATVPLGPWLMREGRRYLTVAGPHMRPAGRFTSLRLHTLDRPVDTPLFTFAFLGDTHVRLTGREDWMNRKMGDASAPELLKTLRALAREGVAFVMHGGDMTDQARRDEFSLVRSVFQAQPLPVYGCIGNHDRYLETSRHDALEVLAAHFPGGALDYVVDRAPFRLVVLDVALEQEAVRASKVQWLRDTLAADRTTPTVFVWHYPPFNRGSRSTSGFRLQDWSQLGKETILDVVRASPNVCVSLNGHDHWDEVNVLGGLPFVQNAAFVEWPNTFRVFRVYADRLEWEVRQVANRGFVRESFLPAKAMSWMIATAEGDLGGTVPLRRRA